MNPILLLLYVLLQGNPDMALPLPEDYLELYCEYHTYPECGNMPEPEPEADAKDALMLS